MGRRESPVDDASTELARFAEGLRELRRSAGAPPYRALARDTHYSTSTLSVAASGKALPTREVTLAFVRACGGDEAEWEERWRGIHDAVNGAVLPGSAPEDSGDAGRTARRRVPRWAVLVAVIGLVAVSAIWLVNAWSSPTTADDPAPPAVDNCPDTEGDDNDTWNGAGGDGWTMWEGPAVGPCSGAAAHSAVTGLPDTWDDVFTWSAATGGQEPVSCRVSLFVTDAPVRLGVAEYDVYGSDDDYENRLTTFTVDQGQERGAWVDRGPFDISGGVLNLALVDRGLGDHDVIAGPARFDCAG